MDISFTDGSFVTRMYGASEHGELLAGFQYESDAFEFAKLKIAEDTDRKWFDSHYIICNTCNGKITVVRHQPAEDKSAA